jgi:hypothetical protein
VARKPAASIGSVPTQSRLPTFGALPSEVRWRPWAGSVYGLVVWLGFELGIAPILGLSQADHCDRSTAWRWPLTTCSTAWCYRHAPDAAKLVPYRPLVRATRLAQGGERR